MASSSKKSGNPAKRATSAKEWKGKATGITDLDLPSGNVCRVKRVSLPTMMANGTLPDVLTPIANKAIEAGRSGKKPDESMLNAELAKLLEDEGGMIKMLDSIDQMVASVVIEPECIYYKDSNGQSIPEEKRDPDIMYTDEIDQEDKSFIFQFVVGGSRDLERFRLESSGSLESLDAGESVSLPSE